ncbi:MAG: hypothetical protein KJ896_03545, partial [Nanoarchaeota archaeon]|nr:hypothetical protein [Nanoarchaeota archaeon]
MENINKKFNELIAELDQIYNLNKRPFSPNEFLELYWKFIKSNNSPKPGNIFSIKLSDEERENIEHIIDKNRNKYYLMLHFFSLLGLNKAKISDKIIESLMNDALKSRLSPHIVSSFCYYLTSFSEIENERYCEFFRKIIDKFVKDKNYVAGDVANAAAIIGCSNCVNSIKNILNSDDRNPRALLFARESLEKLEK